MAPWGSSRFSSGVRRARSRHSLQRRQAFPQPPLLLPALGDIPQDGGDPQRLAGGVPQHDDAELDGDTSPVLSDGRDGQKLLPSVARHACGHDPAKPLPVPLSEVLGDDEVQGLTQGFLGLVAEHGLGSSIPETDDAVPVREDDRVRGVLDDALAEPLTLVRHHSSRPPRTKVFNALAMLDALTEPCYTPIWPSQPQARRATCAGSSQWRPQRSTPPPDHLPPGSSTMGSCPPWSRPTGLHT